MDQHCYLAQSLNAAVAVVGRRDGDVSCASRAFTTDSAPQSRVQSYLVMVVEPTVAVAAAPVTEIDGTETIYAESTDKKDAGHYEVQWNRKTVLHRE